ncbi:hypothetical protein PICSAR240_00699 [Mycobacterium avium subsp. paratuberculosis]|uniref:Uncharacterized protein n=1 Tax=Mycolicibacterium paratuberculosis (strain ATCC BAA-968 / K-10) TaxID=262316 RepID=Q742I4_MYCPA|nr:hypothetical protein MAP_0851 [Mycobacterium avium subsp. paratuberculosis K-10]AGL37884.1 hypothetical protein MAP4_3009 [Mycobacterium avium subsp. paratuberculosis MAP4]OVF04190.1 hypothetical protein B0173_01904 [Mycobacterium avium subsp. paratuberculosis]QKU46455.1 hypothetical protein MAP44135_3119 [Mycobacterium avium subsp. paratuberculosis]CAG6851936.1 hypothetical protein PICSAR107_00119 [Mycobacterium avium subsp. paratuberculosis]
MTPFRTTRNHGVSRIHRPSTDHRSALTFGLRNERSPSAATKGLHGGNDENHRLRARSNRTAGTHLRHRSFDPRRREMTPGGPHRGGRGEPDDRGANRDALSHFFAGPTDDDRARLRADLLARAGQVRATGWEPYHGLWSTGEVIGVALLLGDHAELAALGETVQSALERWAFDLWGLDGGQADVDDGCEETREWFLDAAYEFGGQEAVRERSEEPAAEDIPMSELLAAESGHDVDFDPERLGELASDDALREQLSRAAESPTVRRARPRRSSYSDPRDGAK